MAATAILTAWMIAWLHIIAEDGGIEPKKPGAWQDKDKSYREAISALQDMRTMCLDALIRQEQKREFP